MSLTMDPYNLVICGVGGQGNILISRLIGRVLSKKGYYLTIGETFGAAQRGGSVFSSLRVSKNKLYGPLIPLGRGNLILSLEPLETLRLLSRYGNEQTKTLTNTQTIIPVGVLAGRNRYPKVAVLKKAIEDLSGKAWFVPATEIAVTLNAPIVANIVLLGSLIGSNLLKISEAEVQAEMRNMLPASRLELNYEALEQGIKASSTSV